MTGKETVMIAIIGLLIVALLVVGGIVTAVINALFPNGSSGKKYIAVLLTTFALVGVLGGAFFNLVSLPVDEARPRVSEDRTGICFSDPTFGHSIEYCVWEDDSKEEVWKTYEKGKVIPIEQNPTIVRSRNVFLFVPSGINETKVYIEDGKVTINPIIPKIKSIIATYKEREPSDGKAGNMYAGYTLRESDFDVKGINDKGEEIEIDGGYTISPGQLKEKENTIELAYGVSDERKATCKVDIFAYTPSLLSIKVNLKTNYKGEIKINDILTNEMFDVVGTYENGEKRRIEDFLISPSEMPDEEGTYLVTISKEDFRKDIEIEVKDPTNIVTQEIDIGAGETGNDSINTANDIAVNQKTSGKLVNEKDVDYYRFKIQNKGSIKIIFQHEKIDYEYGCWNVDLFARDTEKALAHLSSTGSASVTETPVVRLAAGTYYIKVSHNNYQDKDYLFQIVYSAEDDFFESEPNEEISEATPIVVNPESPYTGNLSSDRDSDYYVFEIPEKGKLSIDFEHNKIDNEYSLWEIVLMDDSDEAVTKIRPAGNVSSTSTDFVRVPAGMYYVKIASTNWYNGQTDVDYRFKVNYWLEGLNVESEPNGEYKDATQVSLFNEMIGNIQTGKDEDFYVFTIDDTTTIHLDFMHEKTDYEYTLWNISFYSNTAGEPLKDKDERSQIRVRGNDAEVVACEWEDLTADTYYLKISGDNFGNSGSNSDYKIYLTQ